jgi:polyhydroxyalkanoate synthesis regulator phasin
MTQLVNVATLLELGLLAITSVAVLQAQSFVDELKAEHDPARRSELALTFADTAFDSARDFYSKGEVHKGDAQLEDMTNALNECVTSLEVAHKAKFYKKAELRVAYLQRRMKGLLDDIEAQQRGWAEYTERKLDEIHDKLLDGVMRK